MSRALAEASRAMEIYPKNIPERNNLGLYAMYAGDFDRAIKEQRIRPRMKTPFCSGTWASAFLQLGQGNATQAIDTYRAAAGVDAEGPRSRPWGS